MGSNVREQAGVRERHRAWEREKGSGEERSAEDRGDVRERRGYCGRGVARGEGNAPAREEGKEG